MNTKLEKTWENKQDLEDYDQFVIEQKLRGKRVNFVDFLRTKYGRKNSAQYEARKNIINALPLSFCKKENQINPDFDKKIEDFDYIFKKIDKNLHLRVVFVLLVYGFNYKEIGFCLNVKECYVSILVKKLISLFKRYHPNFL